MESQPLPTLAELEDWARDPTRDNWRNLLRVLTDLFVADIEEHVGTHGDAYAEVVCKLLDQVATEVRAELSQRVAPMGKFPTKVVRRLANDEETSVATPMLEQSPVLTENDLVGIIDMMMPERSLAISKRNKLGQRVTDMLAKRGDEDVIRAMASNPGAAFSDRTYRFVAERAKKDPLLQEALVSREDMTQAVVCQITPFLSEELKARLKALDEPPEGGSLLESLTEIAGESEKKKAARKEKAAAYAALEQVRAGGGTASDVARKMSDRSEFGTLVLFLSSLAKLPEATVTAVMTECDGEKLTTLGRGLALSRDTFSSILSLCHRKAGRPAADAAKWVQGYEKTDPKAAEQALKAWRDVEAKSADDKSAAAKTSPNRSK